VARALLSIHKSFGFFLAFVYGAPPDPFNPTSCKGQPLNLVNHIKPGAAFGVLLNYTLFYQRRTCTKFTGCGDWEPAKPSWGPSGTGAIFIKVTSTGLILAIVDRNAGSVYGTPRVNLGMDCKRIEADGSIWDCGRYYDTEISEGVNFLKFEGKDKFSGVELPIRGDFRSSCLRIYGNMTGKESAGSYFEYRGGFATNFL